MEDVGVKRVNVGLHLRAEDIVSPELLSRLVGRAAIAARRADEDRKFLDIVSIVTVVL